MNTLPNDTLQRTAGCNRQGRVMFIADILQKNQHYQLTIPTSMCSIVKTHMEHYARFSQCKINDLGSQPRAPSAHLQHILQGLPMIYPATSEKIIAQRLNLAHIPGAMSFKKGCYLGQEVLARLHFKGQLKHHLYLGELAVSALPPAGMVQYADPITTAHDEITGMVIDFCLQDSMLYVLFTNAVENTAPYLHQHPIIPRTLPYVFT